MTSPPGARLDPRRAAGYPPAAAAAASAAGGAGSGNAGAAAFGGGGYGIPQQQQQQHMQMQVQQQMQRQMVGGQGQYVEGVVIPAHANGGGNVPGGYSAAGGATVQAVATQATAPAAAPVPVPVVQPPQQSSQPPAPAGVGLAALLGSAVAPAKGGSSAGGPDIANNMLNLLQQVKGLVATGAPETK